MVGNRALAAPASAQNQKGASLAEIQRTDKQWKASQGLLPVQKANTSNPCAAGLRKIIGRNPSRIEGFGMDNQGANVCRNSLASDCWRGDEAKRKNPFNQGKGGPDAGGVGFDKSAKANLRQVSLPIVDGKGEVIGALTFGLAVGTP